MCAVANIAGPRCDPQTRALTLSAADGGIDGLTWLELERRPTRRAMSPLKEHPQERPALVDGNGETWLGPGSKGHRQRVTTLYAQVVLLGARRSPHTEDDVAALVLTLGTAALVAREATSKTTTALRCKQRNVVEVRATNSSSQEMGSTTGL